MVHCLVDSINAREGFLIQALINPTHIRILCVLLTAVNPDLKGKIIVLLDKLLDDSTSSNSLDSDSLNDSMATKSIFTSNLKNNFVSFLYDYTL